MLTVLDQAYFEYVESRDYPDAIEEYAKAGARVLVLRTFSKIYGLAALRVGYGVGPAEVITTIGKVRRAFDVTQPAQEAALASLDDEAEIRAAARLNRRGDGLLHETLRRHGLGAGRPGGRELRLRRRRRGRQEALNDALLRRGVVVRPMGAFGAPTALRITAGHAGRDRLLRRAARRRNEPSTEPTGHGARVPAPTGATSRGATAPDFVCARR